MNDLQKKTYTILVEIDRACRKVGIKYFLGAGSALGAVRHKGFIPWDDDIDVMMPRRDYSKFLRICKSHLGSDFDLQCIEYDSGYILPFAKISIKNTTFIENKYLNYKIDHRVSVDIFPLDGIPDNTFLRIFQNALRCTNRAIARLRRFSLGKNDISLWCLIERLFSNRFWSKVFFVVSWLMENIVDSSKCEIWISSYGKYAVSKETCPASYWGESVLLPFETGLFPLPELYHDYLTNMYGDYMVLPSPEEQKLPHPAILDLSVDYKKYFNHVEASRNGEIS